MVTRGRKGASGADPTDSPRWLIIENLEPDFICIPPENRRVDGKEDDLLIHGHDYVAVRSGVWEDDFNLQTQIDSGRVRVYHSDRRPPHVPNMPPECSMGDPRLNGMLHEIVMGKRGNAEGFIQAEPRFLDRPGQPLDRDWLKDTGFRLLEAARKWLLKWGPPEEQRWRLDMIDERIEWIRKLP